MLTRILALCVLFATTSASYPVFAQETGDPTSGLNRAQQVCVHCHAVRKGDVSSPVPIVPSFEAIANTAGVTGKTLEASLQIHENMPNFLPSRTDRDNVIAYILSLKRERQGMIRKIPALQFF